MECTNLKDIIFAEACFISLFKGLNLPWLTCMNKVLGGGGAHPLRKDAAGTVFGVYFARSLSGHSPFIINTARLAHNFGDPLLDLILALDNDSSTMQPEVLLQFQSIIASFRFIADKGFPASCFVDKTPAKRKRKYFSPIIRASKLVQHRVHSPEPPTLEHIEVSATEVSLYLIFRCFIFMDKGVRRESEYNFM